MLIARPIGPTYIQLYALHSGNWQKTAWRPQEARDSEKSRLSGLPIKEYVSEPAKQLLAELAAKTKSGRLRPNNWLGRPKESEVVHD